MEDGIVSATQNNFPWKKSQHKASKKRGKMNRARFDDIPFNEIFGEDENGVVHPFIERKPNINRVGKRFRGTGSFRGR
ncbi:hypothetical protein QTN25_010352 [Entamoeba marina]